MNITKFVCSLFALTLMVSSGLILTAESVQAERPPEVKYEVSDMEGRADIMYFDRMRVNRIVNDYVYKMKAVEKYDNDLRYILIESNKLTLEELGKFLDKNAMPISQTLVFKAGEITSESSALRQLHALYIQYVTERHKALSALAVYAKEKAPKTTVAASITSHGSNVTYVETTDKHTPKHTYDNVAAYRQRIADCDSLRNVYYNRKDYILRNSLEIIGEEK
ncbi:MAG: hypothetical protein ACI376_06550 [Candidatus Bruticola sp.]